MSETMNFQNGTIKNISSLNRNIPTTHQDIASYVNDVYKGDVDHYLVLHDKETNITKRLQISAFNNYIKGIVDSLLNPVFSKNAVRETDGNVMFDAFLLNCDARGNDIQKFCREVVKYTKLDGVTFVVMDNFSEVPDTIDEAINTRTFPYIYQVNADEVADYSTDDFGNLTSILFESECDDEGTDIYTYIDALSTSKGYMKDGAFYITETIEHNLGFLPVISLYDSLTTEILPCPPFKDICDMNIQIYNQNSELRVLERNSCFSMLTIDCGGDEHNINLDIGSSSILTYGSRDKTVNAPSWISPDAAVFQTMMNSIKNSVDELFQQASMLGVNIIANDSSTSGDHLQMKYVSTTYAIQQVAALANEFEIMVAELFGLFTNTTIIYRVKYDSSYLPTNMELTSKLITTKELLSMDLSEDFKQKIRSQIESEMLNFYGIEK